MIQIKGQYTLDDFKKAQQLHARQSTASYGTHIFLVALAVLFYVSLIILVLLDRLQWPYLLAPLALLMVFLVFQFVYKPFMLGRTFKKHKDLSAPFEMELSNQGLSVSNPKGSALIPWNNFLKWAEGREMVLLYRSYIMFQMLPKRLFARQADLQFLREQLTRNNIPQAGKVDKRISTNRLLVYIFLFIAILAMIFVNISSIPR
jgi:Flp pilus assembly protein TadB